MLRIPHYLDKVLVIRPSSSTHIFIVETYDIKSCVDGKHSHLDLTHATGCKHPRLRLSREWIHRWRWRQLYAPAALYSPENIFFSLSGIHVCWRLDKLRGLLRPEGLGKLKKFGDLIGNWNHELPACSIATKPLRSRLPSDFEITK
jgi:hypothetical protein